MVSGAWGARTVAVEIGPYNLTSVEIDAWTLHSIDYGGRPFITPTGFMQTVVSMGPPGSSCCPGSCCHWNGTGHGGEVVFNVTLEVDGVPHPLPLRPTPSALHPTATAAAAWTECDRIFGSGGGNCAAVGLVEGGADAAACEAACLLHPTCTAFNLRLVDPGGCSLRACTAGTVQ